MTRTDSAATQEAVRDILTPFTWSQVKAANKEMKRIFGGRLSQVKAIGPCQYAYYIITKEFGEDTGDLSIYRWDFFYSDFAEEFI